jgi:effector-binding domain-containing protein
MNRPVGQLRLRAAGMAVACALFGAIAILGGAGPIQAQNSPVQTTPPAPPADVPPGSATVERLTYAMRPVAATSGSSGWENGYKALMEAFAKIRGEMAKAGLEAAGRPLAVFLETDDEGFRYDAMIPVGTAPPGPAQLGNGVRLANTPTGFAMKFQHRGSYEEIDATYEAITAYLDEKGLNAANLFIEEYLNDVATSDDSRLEIDIYVFLR